MSYFNKIGRWSDDERAVINNIDSVIAQKQIPLDVIPQCQDLDDLLEVLELVNLFEKQEVPVQPTEQEDETIQKKTEDVEPIEVEELEEIDELIDQEKVEQLESEPVDDIETIEPITIDESLNSSGPDFEMDEYDPFADDIIERSYNQASTKETKATSFDPLDEPDDIELEESKSTPVDNINPKTKQRAAEQTADAILKGYARIAPMPFKWLAKVNEQKIEELEWSGQIDISIEVDEGTTFEEYMKQTNEQVDDIFEVDDDTLDEIREPLIEVLMEQEMELTPQQRLMMAVASHLFQMLTVSLKLRKQNNRILEYQKHITQLSRRATA